MFSYILHSLLFFHFCQILVNCESSDCFRAAVYQHFPLWNTSEEYDVITKRNLDLFQQIAAKASEEGAKILVFPENGIIKPADKREENAKIAEPVPNPLTGNHNPCENPEKYKTFTKTYRLSCFAKNYGLYIVADYGDRVDCDEQSDPNCPHDGHYLFNTAVAFGPDGAVVAKYHKMQPFYEYSYNVPPKPEFIYFDTSFGRIGLFICFDIIFRNPGIELISKYGVQTMVFPTWWFDELPYRTAQQIQEEWSIINQVNLLSSNMHIHYLGSTGSGIFSGLSGQMITSDIMEKSPHLLIADIPIDSRNTGAKCLTNRYNKTILNKDFADDSEYKPMVVMDLKNSALFKLRESHDSIHLCHNHLCCRLDYRLSSLSNVLKEERYWFYVANHNEPDKSEVKYPICEQICGIFRCDDDQCQHFSLTTNQTIFKSLQIRANMSTEYVYPSAVTNHLKLVPKSYLNYQNDRKIGTEIELSLHNFPQSLLSAVLYGRCYDKDPPYKQ